MRYMLLIYHDETNAPATDSPVWQQTMAEYGTFTEDVNKANVFRAGDALQRVVTATSVRVRDGKTITTDGPFAETKEQLGGFYILDCATLDDALAWSARVPEAKHGTIEVRPIMEF